MTHRAENGEDWERVTGRAKFVADVTAEEPLHAAFTLSTAMHARIKAIDVSRALDMPGVVDAITGFDIQAPRLGRALRDYPVLPRDRVLFVGQRVAAVAATSADVARAAAARVKVDYEEIASVPDARAAMARSDDLLHPEYADYVGALPNRPGPGSQGVWDSVSGDGDAFDDCALVYDDTFIVSRSHSAPIETHSCLVAVGDEIHVHSTHKEPYNLRRDIGLVSGREHEEIHVHFNPIGGDFGAKGFPFAEAACYFLSKRTGRPVRFVMSYEEELAATSARHPLAMRVRTGFRGTQMYAGSVETLLDGGAFAGLKGAPMLVVPVIGAPHAPYDVPNRNEHCASVYTNNIPGGHVRSPGEFQAVFAGESHIDAIAHDRRRDPIDFRLDHAVNENVRAVLEAMQPVASNWRSNKTEGVGIGVALCFRDTGPGLTTVRLVASVDTGVCLYVANPDQGVGSFGAFRRLIARELLVPDGAIQIQPEGAAAELQDSGAGASRVTAIVGGAILDACRTLIDRLGAEPNEDNPAWVIEHLERSGLRSVEVTGTHSAGWPAPPGSKIRSYGGVVIEVGVDVETGAIQPRRAHVVADTGVILNPIAHRGQIEGGFIYGLSQTLIEELLVEDGAVTTRSLHDYRLASAVDIPPLEIHLIPPGPEDEGGPIRSVGELVNVGVAPAIANALFDAVQIRVRELPIRPERVLEALHSRRAARH